MNLLTILNHHHLLQVGQIFPVGGTLREGAVRAEHRFLTAFFTNSHKRNPFVPVSQTITSLLLSK
jgi:hypothetical protein